MDHHTPGVSMVGFSGAQLEVLYVSRTTKEPQSIAVYSASTRVTFAFEQALAHVYNFT